MKKFIFFVLLSLYASFNFAKYPLNMVVEGSFDAIHFYNQNLYAIKDKNLYKIDINNGNLTKLHKLDVKTDTFIFLDKYLFSRVDNYNIKIIDINNNKTIQNFGIKNKITSFFVKDNKFIVTYNNGSFIMNDDLQWSTTDNNYYEEIMEFKHDAFKYVYDNKLDNNNYIKIYDNEGVLFDIIEENMTSVDFSFSQTHGFILFENRIMSFLLPPSNAVICASLLNDSFSDYFTKIANIDDEADITSADQIYDSEISDVENMVLMAKYALQGDHPKAKNIYQNLLSKGNSRINDLKEKLSTESKS